MEHMIRSLSIFGTVLLSVRIQ